MALFARLWTSRKARDARVERSLHLSREADQVKLLNTHMAYRQADSAEAQYRQVRDGQRVDPLSLLSDARELRR